MSSVIVAVAVAADESCDGGTWEWNELRKTTVAAADAMAPSHRDRKRKELLVDSHGGDAPARPRRHARGHARGSDGSTLGKLLLPQRDVRQMVQRDWLDP